MEINCWIAMTAAEFAGAKKLPSKLGWMACHFSQNSNGLSNLPRELPENAVLILDDSRPPDGHDPRLIERQLVQIIHKLHIGTVLLDFQEPGCAETAEITRHLAGALPCPVCVAAPYAFDLTCPVLIPPPLPHQHLKDCLKSWHGREIWMEATLEAERITVTEQGSSLTPLPYFVCGADFIAEEALNCRYQVQVFENRAEFTLVRDGEMLKKLLAEAKTVGVSQFIGLFQQLGCCS